MPQRNADAQFLQTAENENFFLNRDFEDAVKRNFGRKSWIEEADACLLDGKLDQFAALEPTDDGHFIRSLDRDAKFQFIQLGHGLGKTIEAEAEAIFFKAVTQFAQIENAAVHRAGAAFRRKKPRPKPFEIGGFPAVHFDLEHFRRRQVQRVFRQLFDGLGKIVGSFKAKSDVNSREMFAVERIEFRVVRGAVFRAVPPAPIAAFRGKKGLFCFGERFR